MAAGVGPRGCQYADRVDRIHWIAEPYNPAMNRLYQLFLLLAVAMFAYAPFMIVQAPYESTMGLVQKIFYFHFPSWIVMFTAATVCGVGGALYLFTSRPAAPDRTGRRGGAVGPSPPVSGAVPAIAFVG